MEDIETGWVIANTGHPNNGTKFIVPSTFSTTRTKAIANFIEGSGNSWRYWKKEYNFCAVKATHHIKTIEQL